MTALVAIGACLILMAAVSLALTALINHRDPPEGRLLPAGGGRLHVAERGADKLEAAAVLLIHGASSTLGDQMVALADALSPRYRVIAVDRPGQGWSDRPGGGLDASPARQASLIVEAARAAGVETAIVVGHSLGAAVAAALALKHPSFVKGLVFVAPATHPWPGGVAWYYRLCARPLLGRAFALLAAPIMGSLLLEAGIRSVFSPQAPPAGYARRTGAARAITPERFRANSQDVATLHGHVEALSPRYHEIRAPCAIVTGDRDSTVWPSLHSEGLARDIEGSKLVVLEGVGHMPHHVRPEAVRAAIDDVAAAAMIGAESRIT